MSVFFALGMLLQTLILMLATGVIFLLINQKAQKKIDKNAPVKFSRAANSVFIPQAGTSSSRI